MTWAELRETFERDFFVVDILYMSAHEYFNLRQKHMIVKKFSIKLNALAW